MNYIECINVDFKSTRKESFYDLQLDVKGCRDVYASFDKYVEVERLEGDNKYQAEEHGLQVELAHVTLRRTNILVGLDLDQFLHGPIPSHLLPLLQDVDSTALHGKDLHQDPVHHHHL
ncbi:hypothetical protein L2E82_11521 [Cichorium intybus]|uniref:Uncharacterized protein n=1 Tax=Cichorium intybus TaxID=13427 RepID=A0ACB9GDJ2_CICIN|nr:hypothetical protein L2E82_11521 [Cichorium intybus]